MVRSATPFDLDSVIAAQLQGALARMPLLQLRKLLVSVSGGAVTLRGELHTAFEKEVALACARRIAPDREVVDATRLAGEAEGDARGVPRPALAWLERRIAGAPRHSRPSRLIDLPAARAAALQVALK